MKVAVAIIHGMGADKHGFSHPLQRGIAKAFTKLKLSHHWDDLVFQEIRWADILTPTQELLYQRITQRYPLRYRRLRRFFIEYLGDVVAYLFDNDCNHNETFRAQVFSRCEQSLKSFESVSGFDKEKTPLVIIGHSLGSVVLLDYLNQQYKQSSSMMTICQRLCGIITLGSPLALWSLKDTSLSAPFPFLDLSLPGVSQSLAKWLNIYDKDDVIAYPLKTINEHWAQAVSEDVAINVGGPLTSWNPLSHQGYWQNRRVHKQIAAFLAALVVD